MSVPTSYQSLLLVLSCCFLTARVALSQTHADGEAGLHLDGENFRITVIEEPGFIESQQQQDGSLKYSGYLVDVLEQISKPDRANFTFDLVRPSGYGSLCVPQLNSTTDDAPYSDEYASQYNCGQTDVTDLPKTQFTTDFYMGLFFIIPRRIRISQFTTPISPPVTGSLVMYGIATEIDTVEDLVRQQQLGTQGKACVMKGTATVEFLRDAYPALEMVEIQSTDERVLEAFRIGTCELAIFDYPVAAKFVHDRRQNNECLVDGKPIGVIGDPMDFGPKYYAMGIRDDIPKEVVKTIDYWLTILMTCNPFDEEGLCRDDSSLVSLYSHDGGATGRECGHVNYPQYEDKRLLAPWAIALIVCSVFVLILIGVICFYLYQLREQRHRIRKRFVWQIARNIDIGPSPGMIPADKLVEEVQHIGGTHGFITKANLSQWINDVKMTFISTKDFDALWAAMDVDGTGVVDPIEFFVFLSSCGPEFEEVYKEQQNLPKIERLKLAARRLQNIEEMGEEGVRRSENSIERSARLAVRLQSSSSNLGPKPAKSSRLLFSSRRTLNLQRSSS